MTPALPRLARLRGSDAWPCRHRVEDHECDCDVCAETGCGACLLTEDLS